MNSHLQEGAPDAPRFREALRYWFRLGLISFGGPAGQIAIMHQELVEKRRWISEGRFLHALNYCMLLPGPEAQQLATYIGWLLHRTPGGVAAGVLFVLPSLLLLIALSWLYVSYGNLPLLAALFYGLKPAVTAIVLQAAHRIGTRALANRWLWGLAALSFVAIALLHVPFPYIVLMAAVLGAAGGRWRPALFDGGGRHAARQAHYGAALIDDHTPRPAHAHFRWSRLLGVALIGVALWALPMAALHFWRGAGDTLTHMGWFFTKAALLTFGGAYAVLPYVYQGAVAHFGWLTPAQMIDGLALGETTPGPLIMVVAFVAFVGGHGAALPVGVSPAANAVLAALLVTWFTFLPSFLFILAGAPLVESTRDALHFTAPLTAITAAVVGVVASLAVFFAHHTFWPQGLDHAPDWPSVGVAVMAFVALFQWRIGLVRVLAASALAGVAIKFLF
ncbi:MAG: chromate efflux transporter [Gammaproteobacteria bacterium]|nr:chromate efflux transporter [Gammaproteobacteria bacterium]